MTASSPPIWKIFRAFTVIVPLSLAVMGGSLLFDDYRFLATATERSIAVVTQTAPGQGVLLVETPRGPVRMRGSPGSAGWGTRIIVVHPPGQPEFARSEKDTHGRIHRGWVFLIFGLICAVLFPRIARLM